MLAYLLQNNFVRISVFKYLKISLGQCWLRLKTVSKMMKEAHFLNLSKDYRYLHKEYIWFIIRFMFLYYFWAAAQTISGIVRGCMLSVVIHLIKHVYCNMVQCKLEMWYGLLQDNVIEIWVILKVIHHSVHLGTTFSYVIFMIICNWSVSISDWRSKRENSLNNVNGRTKVSTSH